MDDAILPGSEAALKLNGWMSRWEQQAEGATELDRIVGRARVETAKIVIGCAKEILGDVLQRGR